MIRHSAKNCSYQSSRLTCSIFLFLPNYNSINKVKENNVFDVLFSCLQLQGMIFIMKDGKYKPFPVRTNTTYDKTSFKSLIMIWQNLIQNNDDDRVKSVIKVLHEQALFASAKQRRRFRKTVINYPNERALLVLRNQCFFLRWWHKNWQAICKNWKLYITEF